jgi:hypothetical protein
MDRLQIQAFVVGGTTISGADRFTIAFSDDLEMLCIMHGGKSFEKLLKFRTESVVSFIRRSPKSISSRFRKRVDFQDRIIAGRFLERDATISRGLIWNYSECQPVLASLEKSSLPRYFLMFSELITVTLSPSSLNSAVRG